MSDPRALARLSTLPAGSRAIVGVVEATAARVDKLAALGILPGVELRVQQLRPVVVVECGETVLALERDLADAIRVARAGDDAHADAGRKSDV